MHDIMPPLASNAQVIQSYGVGGFRIGNTAYESHVLVTPTATMPWDGVLALESFAPLLNMDPVLEVLLIGTGARHVMIAPELRQAFKARGLGVDTMDTGAACRTFNVLLGEARRVAVALTKLD